MKEYFLGITAFALLLVSACKKEDTKAPYSATITFIEPDAGQVFTDGDSLHMEVDVEANRAIGNIEVLALDLTNNDTLAYYTETTQEIYYPFHEHIMLMTGMAINGKVVASAWETDPTEKISKEVLFTVNP